MKAAKLALAASVALAALVALERVVRRDVETTSGVERLVPAARVAGRSAAAITIESSGTQLTYVRAKGLWRCREAFGAVCETDAVETFLANVLEARGAEVCAGDECVERAGVASPDGLRVALHGPKFLADPGRDTLVEVAFGPSRAGGATFAALAGSRRVLAVDRDPRLALEARDRPAPLVDTRLLAGCFGPGFGGFERMFVDGPEASLELASDAPAAAGEERRWMLVEGEARKPALVWRVGGYVSLWVRARWDAVDDPRQAAALGLDPPLATVTLVASTGSTIEVRVSAPDAANRVHVWNRTTNVVGSVRADLLPLLVPASADFTRVEGGNPWEAWLAPR